MRCPRPNPILSRLLDRLPIATLSPTEAADVLVTEYPLVDATVTANLVDRIEGNSAILPLRSALCLVQCGYSQFCCATASLRHRDPSWIGAHDTTISQWSPMNETLFMCICINLWRLKGHFLLSYLDHECKPGSFTNDPSAWRLMRLLQILTDVASFVRYSSLSSEITRLRILAAAFLPALRDATDGWNAAAASMPSEARRNIGLLAARCLRHYGIYLKDYHKMFITLLLDAATIVLAEKAHCMQTKESHAERLIRARAMFDIVVELIPLRVGLSTGPPWAQEEWKEYIKPIDAVILGFAKRMETDSASLWLDTSDGATEENISLLVEFRRCQVEVIRGLSMSMVFMQHDDTDGRCRAVGALQQLLLSLCNSSFMLKRSQIYESNFCSLTAEEWCHCFAAVRVLHSCQIHLSTANTWLLDEAQSICAKGERTLSFYRTFTESLCLWWPNDPAAWEFARMALPRCLDTPLLSARQLIGLLDTLCRASSSLPPSPSSSSSSSLSSSSSSSSHIYSHALSSSVEPAVVEMRNSCLRCVHNQLKDVEPHVDIVRGLLHLGATAARGGGDLFAGRRTLRLTLAQRLLPLHTGMRKLFTRDGEYFISSDENIDAALSGGAFWFVCDACQWAFVWRPACAGAAGQCNCWLRPSPSCATGAEADAAVEIVELFGPELFHTAGDTKATPLRRLLAIRDTVGTDAVPNDVPGKALLVECHQWMLKLPKGAVGASHVFRVLQLVLRTGPRFFALVPELPDLLLRCFFETDGALEALDAQGLWEMCLFTCAREVARVGARYPLDALYRDGISRDATALENEIYETFGVEAGENARLLLCALRADSENLSDTVFVTQRKRILQRALELTS